MKFEKFFFMLQASYWHDPMGDEINYSNYNLFLADINQVKVESKEKNFFLHISKLNSYISYEFYSKEIQSGLQTKFAQAESFGSS